jgi:hypothetical protein
MIKPQEAYWKVYADEQHCWEALAVREVNASQQFISCCEPTAAVAIATW